MRLPNSYGTVYRLQGNRRKPYAVAITLGYDIVDGKLKRNRQIIGYTRTKKEGLTMLAEYHKDPSYIEASTITVRECYEKWSSKHFENVSPNTAKVYRSAYRNMTQEFLDMPIASIKPVQIDDMLDTIEYASSRNKVRMVLVSLFEWAFENDIVTKNYAKMTKKAKTETKVNRSVFTTEEIKWLFDNIHIDGVPHILISIYTGMRPTEMCEVTADNINYDNWTIRCGIKTEAGKNRIVPIHEKIRELIPCLETYISYQTYGRKFKKVCQAGNFSHTPHDTRHTFVTYAKECRMDDNILKLIVGHAISDITEKVYTHRKIEQLHEEMAKFDPC